MIKFRKIAAAAVPALLLGVLVPPSAEAAGRPVVSNSARSVFTINAYTGAGCRGAHYLLAPGQSRSTPTIRSVRVNAFSVHEGISAGVVQRSTEVRPNACASISSRYATTRVRVYARCYPIC